MANTCACQVRSCSLTWLRSVAGARPPVRTTTRRDSHVIVAGIDAHACVGIIADSLGVVRGQRTSRLKMYFKYLAAQTPTPLPLRPFRRWLGSSLLVCTHGSQAAIRPQFRCRHQQARTPPMRHPSSRKWKRMSSVHLLLIPRRSGKNVGCVWRTQRPMLRTALNRQTART